MDVWDKLNLQKRALIARFYAKIYPDDLRFIIHNAMNLIDVQI